MKYLRMIRLGALVALMVAIIATDTFAASRATRARSFINEIVKNANAILAEDNVPLPVREQRFHAMLYGKFDFVYITKFVIGPNWETLPQPKKNELLTLFRQFFLRAYASQFGGYPEDSCVIVSASETGSTESFVLTRLIRPNRPAVSVRWRVREYPGGQQKIIDLLISGTSVLLSHHENFYHLIDRGGVERIITLLKIREQRLSAGNQNFGDGEKLYQAGRFSEAFDIWHRLAEQGSAEAAFNVAAMYEEGRGVAPSADKAESWNNKALVSGYPPALHNRALELLSHQKNESAVTFLKKAGEQSFPPSWHTLGKLYEYGIGVKKSMKQAIHYFTIAADAGFSRSQYSLAKLYRDGKGVKADEKTANKWFEAAAKRGYGRAQDRLAARYAAGTAPEKDKIAGLKWAILANQNGIEGASERELYFRSHMTKDAIRRAELLAAAFLPLPD
ncbi:MAG: hypothetical protein EP348_10225 [Alphaproteobacteria bacterium]|nr:MAG: hypothetical protein EP348_10225 [Alphaproteobacteria bacterium]